VAKLCRRFAAPLTAAPILGSTDQEDTMHRLSLIVVAALAVAASAHGAGYGSFKTPSGNIVCFHSPGPKDRPRAFLGCGIKTGLKPAPPRRRCKEGGYAGDRVELFATGRVHVPSCAGDPGPFVGLKLGARVLGYGKTWSGGGLRCRSTFKGLTCRNKSGHGFFLSRAKWRSF
jgi:hypothetical protein